MEKYSLAAYSAALKNGWSEDLPLDYKRVGKNYFTKETVFKLSQGCTSRTDFKNKYSRAYVIARQNGWLDDMPWLLPQNSKWDKAAVLEESKKYTSAKDFRQANYYVFSIAEKHGWFDEMPWLFPLFSSTEKD